MLASTPLKSEGVSLGRTLSFICLLLFFHPLLLTSAGSLSEGTLETYPKILQRLAG